MDYKPYEKELINVHNDLGLLSAYTPTIQETARKHRKDFLIKEAWARYILACVFAQINPYIEVHQHPQYDTFDADIESGHTIQVETKCRNFKSNRYKTDNISVGKGDEIIGNGGLLVVFFNDDGAYRVYDLSTYHPEKSEWKHKHYSSKADDLENYEQVEQCWVLEPSRALYTGKLKRKDGTEA